MMSTGPDKNLFDIFEHHSRNTILILRYKLVKAGIPKSVVTFFLVRAEDMLKLTCYITKTCGKTLGMIFPGKDIYSTYKKR